MYFFFMWEFGGHYARFTCGKGNALQEMVSLELLRLCEANERRFQAVDLLWEVSEKPTLYVAVITSFHSF
jgi:hypothetical protein